MMPLLLPFLDLARWMILGALAHVVLPGVS